MRVLYQRLYIKLTALVLLLACCPQAQAQPGAQEYSNLMQYIVQEKPVLANLVTKAGLTPLLSDNSASFTVLAPPEAELQKLEELSPTRIRAIITGHILKGLYPEKNLHDGAALQTLAGTSVNICRKRDYVLVDGVRITGAAKLVGKSAVYSLAYVLNP